MEYIQIWKPSGCNDPRCHREAGTGINNSDDVDDVDDVDNVMIMVLMKVMMTVNVMALFLLVSQRQADLCIMNHPGRLFMTMMMIKSII